MILFLSVYYRFILGFTSGTDLDIYNNTQRTINQTVSLSTLTIFTASNPQMELIPFATSFKILPPRQGMGYDSSNNMEFELASTLSSDDVTVLLTA